MATVFADNTHSAKPMAEINITPLVDVMLVLLIIFMVTAPMVTRTLEMRLPQHTPPDARTEPPPRITLDVQADGGYVLDGTPMTRTSLDAALTDIAHGAPTTIVEIIANENAEYQAFTGALTSARNSGITNIALDR